MRILLVEDDEIFTDILLQSLRSHNYVVDVAEDGQLGWDYAWSAEYDLILIDVGLPELNGISLCEKLRGKKYSTPILLMTAKDAAQERIRGLDAGADDYLIKPLDLEELHARIRALSRRGEVVPNTVLEVEGLKLDPNSCEVSYREQPIKLTPKEYNLLELFLRNPARVFSRSQILDRIWTFDDSTLEESVKAHIKGLRKRLKDVGIADWIENVYGIGYRFTPKPSASQTIATTSLSTQNNQAISGSIEQEFDRKMSQLWQQYQGLMAERMEILNSAVSMLNTTELSPELQQSAEKAAHKLAGVLGMFGRDEETELARQIENLLERNSILSPVSNQKLISLVDDLNSLLTFEASAIPPSIETAKLLLIGDLQLGEQLQQLAHATGINWQQIDNLESAQIWLQEHSPYLVVIDLEKAGEQLESLTFMAELAQRTPSLPVLLLASGEQLDQRAKAARLGATMVLIKPVTADRVWDHVSELLRRDRTTNPHVLVLDDDPVFLATLRPLLEPWGMRVTTLDNPWRFWEILPVTSPDLLILDVEMPEIDGIAICQAIRTDPQWQALPVFFLTAHRDSETIQQIFAAGADDYVTKPVVGAELLARLTNRLERNRLLQNLSYQDPLTGLMNQPRSSRELELLRQQAQKNGQFFTLAVLSIAEQELRQIKVKYGHTTSNLVLHKWSQLLQAEFSRTAILGYWGDGEFAIGVSNLDKNEMSDRLSKLLTNLRRQIFTAPNGDRFQVSFRVALAKSPTDGLTLQSLYQFCCQ